jgi:hypothetical protein
LSRNRLGRNLRDLKLEIRSEPPFTLATSWRIDVLADGKSIPVVNPDVQLDAGYLNKLTEAVRGSLQLALREGETEIARESFEIRLLPRSQWSGSEGAPELLAAFVRPNDPAIDQMLRVAATKLEAAGSFEEGGANTLFLALGFLKWQQKDGTRLAPVPVWEAVEAIARGRQTVIVGDPEQLPPTTFGERKVGEDDEYADVVDQESILDECLAATLPQRSLNWHYRSQFESLITFRTSDITRGAWSHFPPT